MHTVAALVTEGTAPFELTIVAEVFAGDHRLDGPERYRFLACSVEDGPVPTRRGFAIATPHRLADAARADTIVVPSWRPLDAAPPPAMIEVLTDAIARGARVMSVCTGAFALGHAGILDGRRCTTHWYHVAELAERFPRATVEPGVLYVDEGQVLTSAGSAGGIDLCLHVVRRDHGAQVANAIARSLVVPPHRDGGQAQFVDGPVAPEPVGDLAPVLEWARSHLDEDLDIDAMATRAAMSRRTFIRRFGEVTGTTPHRWLVRERLLRAQELLETTDAAIELVARSCGFGSPEAFRTQFRRHLSTTPTAYRLTFRQGEQVDPPPRREDRRLVSG